MAVECLEVKPRDVFSNSPGCAQAPAELAGWFAKLCCYVLSAPLPTSKWSSSHYSAHFPKTPAWDWMFGVLLSFTHLLLEYEEVVADCWEGESLFLLQRDPWGKCCSV